MKNYNIQILEKFMQQHCTLNNKLIAFIIGFVLFSLLSRASLASDYYYEINLEGKWKFSIGDNPEWSNTAYNDNAWDRIYVPARWEEQGYQGYDGYAWYRKIFVVPNSFKNRNVFLELGYIDDVDEVYFNGQKIGGSGTFPPYSSTAYNALRKYTVPIHLINFNGNNTIAVRVYDSELEGGIVRGDIKIAADDIAIIPDIDLTGYWDFNTGRNPKEPTQIIVPGQWENQGFYNYDGYALYSKTVDIPSLLANKKLVFMAGRIDDDDEFYINGVLIAKTGDIDANYNNDMYKEFRNYFIPEGIIKSGENSIQIKVRDRGGDGGILEGSIGFITQENFIKYWQLKRFEN